MSAPVVADDLVQGAVKWLAGFPDVTEVLGASPLTGESWIFQGSPWVTVEGTSSAAVVISRQGGWAAPNIYNTMAFPRLGVEVYVDPQRDPAGNVTEPGEVARRLDLIFATLDAHLHRPAGDAVFWGTRRVLTSTRLIEPFSYAVPDGGGMMRLQVFYGVTEG